MKKITQKEKVWLYLKTHGYITTRDAVIDLYVCDLQSVIRDLRNDGRRIIDEWVTNKKTKATYKVYALKQSSIDFYKLTYAKGA